MPPKILPERIGKILVAVDGSDDGEKAGFTASDLARRYGAQLVILHVADYPRNMLGVGSGHTVSVGVPMLNPEVDQERKRAEESIDRIESFASRLGIESTNEIVQTSNSIADTIIDYAYHQNIDLIVTGSRGLNSFQTSTLGSVSN